jgi:hypothetical protein
MAYSSPFPLYKAVGHSIKTFKILIKNENLLRKKFLPGIYGKREDEIVVGKS